MPAPEAGSAPTPLARRTVRALITVAMVAVLPAAAGALAWGAAGAVGALLGAIFTLVVAASAGWAMALRFLPALVLGAAIGATVTGSGLWAVVLALMGVAAGLASHWGMLAPIAVTGMLTAAAGALGTEGARLEPLVALAIAGLYVVLLMRRLGTPDRLSPYRPPMRIAVGLAVVLGAAVLVTSLMALQWDESHAYYFPIFAFALAMPVPGVRVSENARHRVVGAAVALLAAVPLSALSLSDVGRYALVLALIVASLVIDRPMWLTQSLTTLALIMALGPMEGGFAAGETRLAALVTAAVVIVGGGALLMWWAGGREELLRPADGMAETADTHAPSGTARP